MPHRSPQAKLSPFEITALRLVANGRGSEAESARLQVLLSMGLVQVGEDNKLLLTEEGTQRLPHLVEEIESR